MRERGEINIAIANYFERTFNDYDNLNRNDDKQVQNLDEIKHIIIGRWYYGLYLIAKEKLGLSYINHMGYINKYNKKKEYGIWECLYQEAKKFGASYDFEKNGLDLFNLRNKYEYHNIKVTNKNFEKAKNIYNTMYFEFQNIHIKNNPIKSINMYSKNYKTVELNIIKKYIKEIKKNKIYSKIRIFEKSNAYYIYLEDKYNNNTYRTLEQISYSIRAKTRNLISKNIYIDFLENFYDNVSEISDEFVNKIILNELSIIFISNDNVINSIKNQISQSKINSVLISKMNNIINNNINDITDVDNIKIVDNSHKMITMFDNNPINNKNSYKCQFTCEKITIN